MLMVPRNFTKFGSGAISHSGPTQYNKLRNAIKEIVITHNFKNTLKNFLLQIQYPPAITLHITDVALSHQPNSISIYVYTPRLSLHYRMCNLLPGLSLK